MRTAVLGGTRFVGRALVEELAAAGHEVLVVHRGVHEPPGLPDVEHLHVHRRDLPAAADALRRFTPDGAVDVAAMTGADAAAALDALPAGIRLVAVSSIDVLRAYASLWSGVVTDAVPLTEDSPVRTGPPPDRAVVAEGDDHDAAAYEKLDVEAAYLARAATVCRLPMVYGPHDPKRREDFVLRRIRAGRRSLPVGAGGFLWSRGFAPEIARGLRLALETPHAAGEVLTLCEESCAPVRLWVEQIARAAGADLDLVRVPDAALPSDLEITGDIAQHWLTSAERARHVLGWRHADVKACVRASVRWHLAHAPPDAGDFADDDAALESAIAGSG